MAAVFREASSSQILCRLSSVVCPNRETPKPETSKPVTPQPSELKDFAFIVDRRPEGEAAEMMRNMLRAMGCSNRDSMVKEAAAAAAEKPRARVYIVLGREAFHVFAPDQRAALGMWTKVADVPTVVTYSPTKILACFGSVGEGITKAKRQIWTDLKSALSLVGRAPVAVKR